MIFDFQSSLNKLFSVHRHEKLIDMTPNYNSDFIIFYLW